MTYLRPITGHLKVLQPSYLLNSNVSISGKPQIFRFSVNDHQDTVSAVLLDYLVYLDVVRVQFGACVIPEVV